MKYNTHLISPQGNRSYNTISCRMSKQQWQEQSDTRIPQMIDNIWKKKEEGGAGRQVVNVKEAITKLDISSSILLSFSTDNKYSPPPLTSICSTNFEEYSIIPNLIGILFSYRDMIMSTDCKVQKFRKEKPPKYQQQDNENQGNHIIWQKAQNLPQDHKW